MKPLCLIALIVGLCFAQTTGSNGKALVQQPAAPTFEPPEARLPNGKSQHDEIAKADYKKNVEDAAELLKLATELKDGLDRESAYVVSVKSIKKTEDIEKLARNIRGRLKRF